MPAKKIVKKEDIINAALSIVRESGIDALNMRSLAQKCKCSTQPIYLSFSGMEELQSELLKAVEKLFVEYIDKEIASERYPQYKAVGMGYIRFAKEEKELFKLFLMRKRLISDGFEESSFDKSTLMIMQNYGLYKDDATKLHAEMWIFVHGIATMYATGYLDWEWSLVENMLTDAFKGFSHSLNDN